MNLLEVVDDVRRRFEEAGSKWHALGPHSDLQVPPSRPRLSQLRGFAQEGLSLHITIVAAAANIPPTPSATEIFASFT